MGFGEALLCSLPMRVQQFIPHGESVAEVVSRGLMHAARVVNPARFHAEDPIERLAAATAFAVATMSEIYHPTAVRPRPGPQGEYMYRDRELNTVVRIVTRKAEMASTVDFQAGLTGDVRVEGRFQVRGGRVRPNELAIGAPTRITFTAPGRGPIEGTLNIAYAIENILFGARHLRVTGRVEMRDAEGYRASVTMSECDEVRGAITDPQGNERLVSGNIRSGMRVGSPEQGQWYYLAPEPHPIEPSFTSWLIPGVLGLVAGVVSFSLLRAKLR